MDAETAVNLFLRRYLEDRAAGHVRSLAEYQAEAPGKHAARVGEEYARLAADDDDTGAGDVEHIGPYRVLRVLGAGGQGRVYLAEDERLGRRLAVKVLSGLGGCSSEQVRRFVREAEIASRLDHPGIAAVFDTGVDRGVPYIAMRYVEGETLAEKLRAARRRRDGGGITTTIELARPGSASEVDAPRTTHLREDVLGIVRLGEQIAGALHAAHEQGVVHRDVKPGNIAVTPSGDPVVLDFGLARELEGDLPTLTRSGDVLGTPAYMSPEQLEEAPATLGRQTDVYSLGVTLQECLTLTRPFEAPTRAALVRNIQGRDPPDAHEINEAVPRDLAVVLQTAMDKDLGRRYATALDFADDLRRVRLSHPIRARPAGPWLRVRRFARRNPALTTALVLLFVSLSAGLIASLSLLRETKALLIDRQTALDQKDAALAEREAALTEVARLADVKRLSDLEQDFDALWPAVPEKLGGPRGMDAWLAAADELLARRAEHAAARARLLSAARDDGTFADPWDAFRHDALAGLLAGLEALPTLAQAMRTRRDFAATVDRRSITECASLWEQTARDVASAPPYRGLQLRPQRGLVPLGPDRTSGLFEFAHLQSGAVPARDAASGQLLIDDDTGIVFVLLPGGRATMGAWPLDARLDADDPHVDPTTDPTTSPVHAVDLAPFFISKYELTQGQWTRFSGGANPSFLTPDRSPPGVSPVTLRHPVENLTFLEAEEVVHKLGLLLPTEAQWEYAARGGTTTIWSTGSTVASLLGHANIADENVRRAFTPGNPYEAGFDDGYVIHGEVGSLLANPFGLHDVHGNVIEFCRDGFVDYSSPARPGDGLRPGSDLPLTDLEAMEDMRVMRGGSFTVVARETTSAFRWVVRLDERRMHHGVRPARPLER